MIVQATIDLDKVGMSEQQWRVFARDCEWHPVIQRPKWNNSIRDMLQGWQKLCTVAEWSGSSMADSQGWTEPGVYALVYEGRIKNCHPILSTETICLGETTQPLYKRVNTHVLALKGKVSNMTEKWGKYDKIVNKQFNCSLRNELDQVWIWTRPHSITDSDWKYDRDHSCHMEKQAHAFVYALWQKFPPANTRDLPDYDLCETAKNFLLENYPGYSYRIEKKKVV